MQVRERRRSRLGLKVIHRHRVGDHVFRRVSELVIIGGRPKALLGWINLAGVRAPIYLCELDQSKLHASSPGANTYYYDEITVDPRFEGFGPDSPGAAREAD